MVTPTEAGADFAGIISENGAQLRFRYFTTAYPGAGSYYDDDVTLTQSGSDLWISGLVQPISSPRGSSEAVLFEQGKIKTNDLRVYLAGSTDTQTSSGAQWKVGVGSPNRGEYVFAEAGAESWELSDVTVYKKLFLTRLTTGSLPEE